VFAFTGRIVKVEDATGDGDRLGLISARKASTVACGFDGNSV
jgi:hypothetical protein